MKSHLLTLLVAGGLLTACNNSIESASNKFNELPPAVQKTVRAQAPNAEIADVSHTTRDGMDVYEVQLRENGQTPKVVVAPDGKLISTDLPSTAGPVQRLLTPTGAPGTPFSALPVAVQKTIQARAPESQVASISRHDDNGRIIYEVEFKDRGKNPTMKVAEDGTLVQDLQK
jgi:uncharacterized membrane protein YkoI